LGICNLITGGGGIAGGVMVYGTPGAGNGRYWPRAGDTIREKSKMVRSLFMDHLPSKEKSLRVVISLAITF
jgi:hypothetical protein